MNKLSAWLRSEWAAYGITQRVAVAILLCVVLASGGVVAGKQARNAFVGGWLRWQREITDRPDKALDRAQVARYGEHVAYKRPGKPLPPIKHTIKLRADKGAVRLVGAKGNPVVAKYPGDHPGAKYTCSLWVDLTCVGRDPFGTPGAYILSGAAECSIVGYGKFYWRDPPTANLTIESLPTGWADDAKEAWLDWFSAAYESLSQAEKDMVAAGNIGFEGTVYIAQAKVGTTSQELYKCSGVMTEVPAMGTWGPIYYGPTEWELAASIEATPVQATATVTDAAITSRQVPRRWTDRSAAYYITSPENSSMTATLGTMSVSATANTADINTLTASVPIANAHATNTVYSKIKSLSVSNALVPCDFSTLNQWTLLNQSYVYATSQPENAYSHCYGTAGGDIEAVILGPNNVSAYLDGGGSVRIIHVGLVKPVVHAAWWAPESDLALPSGARFDTGIEICTAATEDGTNVHETVWIDPTETPKYYNIFSVVGPGADNTNYISPIGRYRMKAGGFCCLPDPTWMAANHLNLPALTGTGEIVEGEEEIVEEGGGGGTTLTNDDGSIAVPAMTLSLDAADPFADCVAVGWDDVEIDIPPGQSSRPSEWAGSGGLTCDPGDSGTWVVSSSPAGPTVTRALKTRWYLRMLYLDGHIPEGGNYEPDWVRQLVANENTGSDLAEWAAAVPVEDVTCWLGDWLKLSFSVLPELAIGENITATIGYSTVAIDDPCYVGYTHRVGPEGEFTFERTSGLTVQIAGTVSEEGEVWFDLGLLKRTNTVNLQHVDSVTFSLPSVEGTYTVSGLTNCRHSDATRKLLLAQPAVDPYNWDEDFSGFNLTCAGVPMVDVPDGTEQYVRGAQGLKQTQFVQHDPDNEGENLADPIYAKALSRLVNELNWLQGFSATYSSAPFYDADNTLLAGPHWWDLRRYDGAWDVDEADLQAAIMVRRVTSLPPLVACTINSYWCVGGGVNGIATSGGARILDDGGPAMPGTGGYKLLQWVGEVDNPMIHWEQVAASEPGPDGRLWIVAAVESSLAVAHAWQAQGTQPYVIQLYNRDLIPIDPVRIGLWEPYLTNYDSIGLRWLIARESDGKCHVAYIDAGAVVKPVWMEALPFEAGYQRPSIAVENDGHLLACATETATGNMVIKRSEDRGHHWSEAMTALGQNLTLGAITVKPGSCSVYLVGHDAANEQMIVRTSSATDLAPEEIQRMASTLYTPELVIKSTEILVRAVTATPVISSIACGADGSLLVASGNSAGGMTIDKCANIGQGFEPV